jgi:hypothetical protein
MPGAGTSINQIITNAALNNGIPPALALAQAQQESGLNPAAYNAGSGATGLFQLEPATAADLGVTNLLDPVQSANGGTAYLNQLYQKFGTWAAALAAYDWGMGNVQKAQRDYGSNWLQYAPSETQNYVSSILSSAGMDDTPVVTPASVVNGAVNAVADIFSPPTGDPTDYSSEADPSATPISTWALIAAGVILGVVVLPRVLADL